VSLGNKLLRVLIAAVLVIGVSVGLRVVRDSFTNKTSVNPYASASVWRKMSVGINGTYLDASLLAHRDWPSKYDYRNGEDYKNGVLGSVPRVLWPAKPDPLPGKWFRQVYQPETRNGWPVGAPTIWYLNFGLIGVFVGGLLSGAVLAWVAHRRKRASSSGVNTAMTFVLMVYVVQLGGSSEAPLMALTWAGPMLLVMAWLRYRHRRTLARVEPVRLTTRSPATEPVG
jgi:hypothetical protein